MGTMVGMGPRPNAVRENTAREEDAEPVYLLTQRRSSIPPPPDWPPGASVPRSSGAQPKMVPLSAPSNDAQPMSNDAQPMMIAQPITERSIRLPLHSDEVLQGTPWDEDDEDDALGAEEEDIRALRRFTRRQRATRVLGVFALAGALSGGTWVLRAPKARHEALAFVTLGHAEGAERLGRSIARLVASYRR
jgi:hypothetical protein